MSGSRRNPTNDDIVLSTTDARQGKSGMGVRYVLVTSTLAAFVVMGLIYVFFFTT